MTDRLSTLTAHAPTSSTARRPFRVDPDAPTVVLATPHPDHGWLGALVHLGTNQVVRELRDLDGRSPLAVPELMRHASRVALTPRHLAEVDARWLILVTDDGVGCADGTDRSALRHGRDSGRVAHLDYIHHGAYGARTTTRTASMPLEQPSNMLGT